MYRPGGLRKKQLIHYLNSIVGLLKGIRRKCTGITLGPLRETQLGNNSIGETCARSRISGWTMDHRPWTYFPAGGFAAPGIAPCLHCETRRRVEGTYLFTNKKRPLFPGYDSKINS